MSISGVHNLIVSLLTVHGSVERKAFVQSEGTLTMEELQIAIIGSFCLNEACVDYKKWIW